MAAGIRKAPSMEWRWVSTEEDDDTAEDGGGAGAAAVGAVGRGGSFESEEEEDAGEEDEEEEEGKQKLIRTRPSVDWFDVEGNEVSVAQQFEDSEVRGHGWIAFGDHAPRLLFLWLYWDRFSVLLEWRQGNCSDWLLICFAGYKYFWSCN